MCSKKSYSKTAETQEGQIITDCSVGGGGGDETGEGYKHFDSRVFGKSVMIDQVRIYCRREYNFGKITSLPIGSWE